MWFADRAELQVGLQEDRLIVQRVGARTQRAEVIDCAPAASGPAWQPAVQALGEWLRQHKPGPVRVQVRLSGHFVRWKLLDWVAALQQPQQLQAYAQMQMRATFGPEAQGWRIVHAEPSVGDPLPVCAIDQALVQALRALEPDTQARLSGLAPYFSVAHDHWRGRIGRGACWFGVIEPTAFTLGLRHQGAWRGLRTLRLAPRGEAAWREVLPALQAQMRLASGHDAAAEALPVYLAGCTGVPSRPLVEPLVWLAPRNGQRGVDGADRMAWGI
ncbi:MAG: hypothetical protein C0443_04400 [Comamonadaceae bacterium]|nr:hypothetical protein [Comamonadaceae bacterium]